MVCPQGESRFKEDPWEFPREKFREVKADGTHLNAMSVDVHRPIFFPLKRLAKNHKLFKQEHLSLARLASLRICYHQSVL